MRAAQCHSAPYTTSTTTSTTNTSTTTKPTLARTHTRSGTIQGYKPRSSHLHRTSYYLLAAGYVPAAARELALVERLAQLVVFLRGRGGRAGWAG